MCSACQGDYENPEPDAELEPEDVVLDRLDKALHEAYSLLHVTTGQSVQERK